MEPFHLLLDPHPLDGRLAAVPGRPVSPAELRRLSTALGGRVFAPGRIGVDLASALAIAWTGPLRGTGVLGFDADDLRILLEGAAGAIVDLERLARGEGGAWEVPDGLGSRVAAGDVSGVLVAIAGGEDLALHDVERLLSAVEARMPSTTPMACQAFQGAGLGQDLLASLVCIRA